MRIWTSWRPECWLYMHKCSLKTYTLNNSLTGYSSIKFIANIALLDNRNISQTLKDKKKRNISQKSSQKFIPSEKSCFISNNTMTTRLPWQHSCHIWDYQFQNCISVETSLNCEFKLQLPYTHSFSIRLTWQHRKQPRFSRMTIISRQCLLSLKNPEGFEVNLQGIDRPINDNLPMIHLIMQWTIASYYWPPCLKNLAIMHASLNSIFVIYIVIYIILIHALSRCWYHGLK